MIVTVTLDVGTLSFFYHYLDDLSNGVHGTLASRIIEESSGVFSALVLLPFVVALTRRFPWRVDRWPAVVAVQALGALCYSIAHTTIMALFRAAIFPLAGLGHYDYGVMLYRYPMEMSNDILGYAIFVSIVYFVVRLDRARKSELATANLEAQLAQARLENLRLQLQPHFLFNTLNAISTVMYEDPQAADTMIARLSEFLRATLDASDEHESSLVQELRMARLYADIMRARLENNLRLDCICPPELGDVLVPTLVLQPLVENAIVHGMADDRPGIDITINARREGEDVVIIVGDDGVGLDGSGTAGEGRGLQNTRQRLAQLYGAGERFRIAARPEGGTVVELRVPYRAA